jgi:hypothetical protein
MLDVMSVLVDTELVVAVPTLRIAAERQPAPACGRASTPRAGLARRHRGPGVRPDVEPCGPRSEISPA